MELPFQVGALYSRRQEIHGLLGGQRQGGISTPKDHPVVIAFTGEAGVTHGYDDKWVDDEFHYVGEGQSGHMRMEGGNRAIQQHVTDGKRLVLFQSTGHGKPYRYWGEFICTSHYLRPDTPASRGPNRNAIVFRLAPKQDSSFFSRSVQEPSPVELAIDSTTALQLVDVRKKQTFFRRQLLKVEKGCRLTGTADLRFLRASHIKPWASCVSGDERTDPYNGLLFTPSADLLFDRGWITFENTGSLVVADALPSDVRQRIGLKLQSGRNCGGFNARQQTYLEYHRNKIFEQRFGAASDPLGELMSEIQYVTPASV